MSPRKKGIDNRTLPLPLVIDVKAGLTRLLKEAAKKSKKSLATIADELTAISGRKVSEPMLKNYLGEGEHKDPYNFPAYLIAAFCTVTGDQEPLIFLLRACGLEAVSKETLKLARLGKIWLDEQQSKNEKQSLMWQLTREGR